MTKNERSEGAGRDDYINAIHRLREACEDYLAEDPDTKADDEHYMDEMNNLVCASKEWKSEHPDADIQIQWNYPSNVTVIATLKESLENKFVMANKDGLELLETIRQAASPERGEITILMARMAVELAYVPERPDEHDEPDEPDDDDES